VSALRPTPVALGAVLAATVSLWVGFAVVAAVTRSAPRPAAASQPRHEVAPIRLTLTPAPALHVRPALLQGAPARATAPRASRATRRARAASPPPAAAMSALASARAAPEPSPAVQPAPAPAPAPRPAPKPRVTRTAAPSKPSTPDFDQSQPDGFDEAG
jgi:hypothetical protein